MDGVDGAEIILIDSRGCPTDPSIMGPVGQIDGSGKQLQAFFEAFKFPTNDVVQFQALVTPCLPSCAPVDCSLPADPSTAGMFHAKSFGRKRRAASWNHKINKTEPENLLVINSIRIADRFKFDENGRRIPMDGSDDVSGTWGEWDVTSSRSVSGQVRIKNATVL